MPTRDEAWPQGTPCWVDCQVDDTSKAREFYNALFGWDIQDGPDDAGGYLMALKGGKPAAGIGPKMSDEPMPSAWTTYFAADSADDVAGKVAAAGGTNFMPPFDVLDVGRMFVAADPTGGVFGVWEAKAHTGAGIYNEHGAYCWNELHTREYAKAQEFYATVFGYTYAEIGDGENFVYSTFTLPGGADSVGGIDDETKMPGDPMPAYWLTWFQVDDLDAGVAKAKELGATVLSGPDDSPFGRMGVVAGPQGEVFGLIDPTTTVGDPPPAN
ncbi:VOC family protein [Antrihabitans stalactiti]|uniref:VOC family protein n=1 Tax=Antrihabitans stalactiti TaxID=2584121 RepID=A0A848KNY8_9NOCA|nr:VOC family protein [Antrihabitans stalactiti]NMN97377.1 VOC family protein [Antrihabitans stalactiti]